MVVPAPVIDERSGPEVVSTIEYYKFQQAATDTSRAIVGTAIFYNTSFSVKTSGDVTELVKVIEFLVQPKTRART